MCIVNVIKNTYPFSKPVCALTILFASVMLVGCNSSDDGAGDAAAGDAGNAGATDVEAADVGTPDTGVVDGATDAGTADALTPDNAPTDVYGDWITQCFPENDPDGEPKNAVHSYAINENTWTESIDLYAADDVMCSSLLGTVIYSYQFEILDTATAVTLNGSSVGNAINVEIIGTTEDGFGEAVSDGRGSGLAVWLLLDDTLYSGLDFMGSQPTALSEEFAFSRQ